MQSLTASPVRRLHRRLWLVCVLTLIGVGSVSPSAFALPTSLAPNPDGNGVPYVARYSTSVVVQALLLEDGAPLGGALVGFYAQRLVDADAGPNAPLATEFLFGDGFTAQDGVVTTRLRLIEGAHGQADFLGSPPSPDSAGEPYRIRMVYLGDLPEGDDGCLAPLPVDAGPAPDAGTVDGGALDGGDGGNTDAGVLDAGPPPVIPTCGSSAEIELFVASETSSLVIAPGNEVSLNETIPLIATLTDEDGDEPPEGENPREKALAGRSITFFYDLDGNGSPSSNERLGSSSTNSNGQAVFDFIADPTYVVAGVREAGIHAQFGSDDQYGLSGASARLTVFAAGADPTQTLLSAEPTEIASDGLSSSTITAVLVDGFNNPLDVDSPSENVAFTTTLGEISDAERDPVTGEYTAELTSSRTAGDATVTIEIDGVPGETITVRFIGGSCDCDQTQPDATAFGGALAIALLFGLTRRRRRS